MVLLRRFWLATVCLCAPALAVPAVAQGFDSGGFNSGGSGSRFAGGGFNSPRGFNVAGFNSAPLPAAGIFGGICGRMLIPAASVGEMSRGFFPGHAGVDLVAVIGTPVRAAAGGVVAPVLLLWGLSGSGAASASLLLNFDGVITTLVAATGLPLT